MNGSDLERVRRPPSSATPARRPEKRPAKARREKADAGAGHEFSALRVHVGDERTPAAPMLAAAPIPVPPMQITGGTTPVAAPKPAGPQGWSETIDRFAHNNAALTARHRRTLDALAAEIAARLALVANGRASIVITGHTDSSGDETYNEALGLKRADAAKGALELALGKHKVGADRIARLDTDSLGETRPAKPTADDVKEPLNRRVEILVTIEGPAPTTSSKPTIPSPDAEPEKKKDKPVDLNLPPDYKLPEERGPRRPPQDDWWKRAEEAQRKIDEYDRTHPRKPKSLNDVLVEGVTKALEPIIKKLPKGLRDKARDAIRKGIEKGTEAGCDAAIDASGATGEEAEALKAACKAALKTKPGEKK